MSMVTIKVEGLKEIDAKLGQLPTAVARIALRKSVRAMGSVLVERAKAKAPVLRTPDPRRTAGLLKKSIKTLVFQQSGEFAAAGIVGVKKLSVKKVSAFKRRTGRKASANPSDPYYYRFVEFGTKKMGARAYLRPAYYEGRVNAVKRGTEVLRVAVDAEIEKIR